MLVLLSCAKTMSAVSKVKVPLTTIPRFQKEAAEIALQMSQFSVDELERLLRVNAKIAVENYKRYQAFHAETTPELPALLAYTGIVFKRLNPKDFSAEDFGYAQEHLRLTSFCYGLLASFGRDSCLSAGGGCRIAGIGESDFVFLLAVASDGYVHRGHPIGRRNLV